MAADIETHAYGIVREWLDERRVVVIKTDGHMQRVAIDVWADLCIHTLQEWPVQQPLLCLCDLCRSQQSFTPYALRRTEDIVRSRPVDLHGRIGVAITNPLVRWQVQMVMRLRVHMPEAFTLLYFGSRAEALDWLRGHLHLSSA